MQSPEEKFNTITIADQHFNAIIGELCINGSSLDVERCPCTFVWNEIHHSPLPSLNLGILFHTIDAGLKSAPFAFVVPNSIVDKIQHAITEQQLVTPREVA